MYVVLLARTKGGTVSHAWLTGLTTFVLIALPILWFTVSTHGQARFKQVGLLSDSGTVMTINEDRTYCSTHAPSLLCYANFNKVLSFSRQIADRFAHTFSTDMLFFNGEAEPKHISTDHFGLLPLVVILFYLLGWVAFVQKWLRTKHTHEDLLVLVGLIVAPIPALLSTGAHRVRLSPLLPFVCAIVMFGYGYARELAIEKLPSHRMVRILDIVVALLLLMNGVAFMFRYETVHVEKYEIAFNSYMAGLMPYLVEQKDTDIFVRGFTEAPAFYAFYAQVDPRTYQQTTQWSEPDAIGFKHPTKVANLQNTDLQPDAVYCQNKDSGKSIVYVSNEDLSNTVIGNPKEVIRTKNGVHSLVYVYGMGIYQKNIVNCDFATP